MLQTLIKSLSEFSSVPSKQMKHCEHGHSSV